ncbi:divalent-cation tolerance protein CutA [Synoicihabitans lomoniglobus]|uniref:Divalent-cation tolerance protein CutA n=1 Tax=Synoicihabitans lomoniglobus TaxID=2909285 RepID=A0AAF0I266_9BACT|nr:divalent-cation tolerance protein CutA [Opitutaceae bacterium LMO-M01]WED66297.1 divalent-cation tolerance protein CutA [Opitutaceae bacterium LMO-M01]
MLIGWTTVETASQAQDLARGLVEGRLAACVQVDGPITSTYRWEGKVESATEYRVTVKFLSTRHLEIEAWLHRHHPYATPQWITVVAEHVAEKYLSWAQANSSSLNL